MADLNDILSDKPLPETKPTAEAPQAEAAPAAEVKDAKADAPTDGKATGEKPEPVKADEGKGAPPAPAKDSEQGKQAALDAERAQRKDWKEKALRLEGELKAIKDREEAAAKAAAAPKPADGQPTEQVPDPLLDPQGYADFIEQRAEARAINRTLNNSEARAVKAHGQELVTAAFEWAKTHVFPANPSAYQRLIREDDPYDVLVNEYQKRQRLAAIGDDPAKYEADLRAKIEAETREKILAEQAEQGISGQPRQAAAPPPSLATARSAAARSSPGFTGPTPLANILQ